MFQMEGLRAPHALGIFFLKYYFLYLDKSLTASRPSREGGVEGSAREARGPAGRRRRGGRALAPGRVPRCPPLGPPRSAAATPGRRSPLPAPAAQAPAGTFLPAGRGTWTALPLLSGPALDLGAAGGSWCRGRYGVGRRHASFLSFSSRLSPGAPLASVRPRSWGPQVGGAVLGGRGGRCSEGTTPDLGLEASRTWLRSAQLRTSSG